MGLFVFVTDRYYPYSAAVTADTKDQAITLIAAAIREDYPELGDCDASASHTLGGPWPTLNDIVTDSIKEVPEGEVALIPMS